MNDETPIITQVWLDMGKDETPIINRVGCWRKDEDDYNTVLGDVVSFIIEYFWEDAQRSSAITGYAEGTLILWHDDEVVKGLDTIEDCEAHMGIDPSVGYAQKNP